MEYEVYRHQSASDEDFNEIDQIFKTVMGEDKVLCEGAQRNLDTGIFMSGQLHPQVEKACPRCYGASSSDPLLIVCNRRVPYISKS